MLSSLKEKFDSLCRFSSKEEHPVEARSITVRVCGAALLWRCSSMAEQPSHTRLVGGSIPPSATRSRKSSPDPGGCWTSDKCQATLSAEWTSGKSLGSYPRERLKRFESYLCQFKWIGEHAFLQQHVGRPF